mgnify:FL=1
MREKYEGKLSFWGEKNNYTTEDNSLRNINYLSLHI